MRRSAYRRRAVALLVLAAVGLLVGLLAAAGPGRVPRRPPHPHVRGRQAAPVAARAANGTPETEPGRLPQTAQLPEREGPHVQALAQALFAAIKSGSLAPAEKAFFPLSAYLQVKAIANPEADYHERLLRQLGLDLEAAHRLLGPDPQGAHLIGLRIPLSYAHWVEPGTCYNRLGYYEVPNSRLVYETEGQVRSLGVASLISWRGVWYIVHLGAVEREVAEGVVDQPEPGEGVSRDVSTC